MGHLRQGLLVASFVLFSCSETPEGFLATRLRSYHVLTDEGFIVLGGWKELETLPPRPLALPPLASAVGETLLYETSEGQGWISASPNGPAWQVLVWEGGIAGIQALWQRRRLYFLATKPVGKLYAWGGFGSPEPVLIPTLLTAEDAELAGAWPVGEEWLLQWTKPRTAWTLFHQRAGLERELTLSEVREWRTRLQDRPATEVPELYRPHLPPGNWTLLLQDTDLPEGRATYSRRDGPRAFGARRGQEVWILDTMGTITGTSGGRVPLVPGVRLVGFFASAHGLLAVWQKPTRGGEGHEGVVFLPWRVLEKSATL